MSLTGSIVIIKVPEVRKLHLSIIFGHGRRQMSPESLFLHYEWAFFHRRTPLPDNIVEGASQHREAVVDAATSDLR